MEFKDYYAVLGVARDAALDDIKRSYRKLARRYHPDVSKETDAEARFKEVAEAWEVLKDDDKRAAYDQLGADWERGRDFQPPPDWSQGFEHDAQQPTAADAARFSDFFEQLFGHRATQSGARRGMRNDEPHQPFHAHGNDAHAHITIDLETAYNGATRSLSLKHPVTGSDGRLRLVERQLEVRIPKGVRAGQQIRLAGQGGAGAGDGQAGDLYLEVAFERHPRYRVDGRDVTLDLPVAPWELALGATIETPTPSGPVELTIPPLSGSGRRLRMRGRGIPSTPPGDLYVILRVTMPEKDDANTQEAWRALAKAAAFDPRADTGELP